jgi:hypothetical protein
VPATLSGSLGRAPHELITPHELMTFNFTLGGVIALWTTAFSGSSGIPLFRLVPATLFRVSERAPHEFFRVDDVDVMVKSWSGTRQN